jgi:hypothetical protein
LDSSLNVLNSDVKAKIWSPDLSFTNALGPFQTEVDDFTTGKIIRNGQREIKSLDKSMEGI